MAGQVVHCPNCGTPVRGAEDSADRSLEKARDQWEQEAEAMENAHTKRLAEQEEQWEAKVASALAESRERIAALESETIALQKSLQERTRRVEEVEKKYIKQKKRLREVENVQPIPHEKGEQTVELDRKKIWAQEAIRYLEGTEFSRRLNAIVESFTALKDELQTEMRLTEKVWAKQQRQIQKALQQTAGMYGDLQGILGESLPRVSMLESPPESDE